MVTSCYNDKTRGGLLDPFTDLKIDDLSSLKTRQLWKIVLISTMNDGSQKLLGCSFNTRCSKVLRSMGWATTL